MEGKMGRIIGAIQREFTEFFSVEMLPNKEELIASFPHKEGCPKDKPLKEDKILFSHGSGWEPAIFGSGLTCKSCQVSQRYREE